MAQAHASTALCFSFIDGNFPKASHSRAIPRYTTSEYPRIASTFRQGSALSVSRISVERRRVVCAPSVSIRCEQSTKEGGGLDVWLGRLAMVGFASAITVEIATGKGLLENFGVTAPLPTVALAVTGLVGVLTAVFIFQSASTD
ncbi:stress enhanced protein 1, chloroplastic-like [Aristolochia californica]|uniref:stress enhanced protein 1, chloroplastic-like n=1 Tax=Aristolochia californica TaxID=171875 RepID=UPI0035D7F72B